MSVSFSREAIARTIIALIIIFGTIAIITDGIIHENFPKILAGLSFVFGSVFLFLVNRDDSIFKENGIFGFFIWCCMLVGCPLGIASSLTAKFFPGTSILTTTFIALITVFLTFILLKVKKHIMKLGF